MILNAPPPAKDETSHEYLARIRTNSNYGVLRTLINISTGLSLAAVWLVTLLIIVVTLMNPMAGGLSGGMGPMALVPAMLGATLLSLLIVAARQSSLLLIDIADTQLDANRRKAVPHQ